MMNPLQKSVEQADFAAWLKDTATALGAYDVGVVAMDRPELRRRIQENGLRVAAWLQAGYHGEMDYLVRHQSQKDDPWRTYGFARSVVVVVFRHDWGDPAAAHPFPEPAPGAPVGYVSAYARGEDYHLRGRRLLSELAECLQRRLGHSFQAAATVDAEPVYDRLFAAAAGLGVRGANELLRVPGRVSTRVFVGCLFVEAALPEMIGRPVMVFECRDCRACLKACPTGALQPDRPMDARRCISYLTIEKRGLLTRQEGRMIGDWLFGCDGCTTVCPPRDKVDARIPVDLRWLLTSPTAALRRRLRDNAVAYAGVRQLRKTAVVLLKKDRRPEARTLLARVRRDSGCDLIRRQLDAW